MKRKPDIEYFFGRIYKGFCGNCGRILFSGGFDDTMKESITICKYCGCEIDWIVSEPHLRAG